MKNKAYTMDFDPSYATIGQLQEQFASGSLSSEELVQHLITRVRALDGQTHAFIGQDPETALQQARASDQRRAEGKRLGPLDGIPIAIKNNMAITGAALTCGSRMLRDFVAPYDATVVQRLKASGAILWGQANMDEFAMGSSNETSHFGPARNPWDLERSPGGSSGGSAVSVAAGYAPVSLGSDTGGSIRQPAAFCGVYGLKPTYGRVSRYGLVAFASSLDQIGPFARSVEDLAHVLQTISGLDPRDSTSFPLEVPNYSACLADAADYRPRIGVPREYFAHTMDAEVQASITSAIDYYRQRGCEIKEVSLPNSDLAMPTYYVLATAEASSNLARFDGVRYTHRSAEASNHLEVYFKSRAEGFGEEVKRRIILGTFVLSSGYRDAYYIRAQKVRTLIRQDFERAFESVDLLLTPTAPTPAFKIGEIISDPLTMYLNDIFTIPVNLAGLPALNVPCGFTKSGLPLGFHLIAPHFQEEVLLKSARLFEMGHSFHQQHPALPQAIRP